jgi:hypothetical protein
MLDGVRDEFVNDQTAGDNRVGIQVAGLHVKGRRGGHVLVAVALNDLVHQVPEVLPEVQVGKLSPLVEFLVDHGHGLDPAFAVL